MLGTLIGPDIVAMIRDRQFAELRAALSSLPPQTLAELFSEMPADDVAVVFRLLPRELAADIFEYLPLDVQEPLLRSLGAEQVAEVLNEMAPDDRTALLEELPGAVTQRLLTFLMPDERHVAVSLLGYPPESVGRRMTPDYVAVAEHLTVGEALDHLRRVGRDKETLNVIYVVDDKGRLIDDIKLRQLILAEPAMPLTDLMDRQFDALRADQDQEEAVRAFQRLDRIALPVVDSTGVLLGIVTVDDVMDVAEEETTEDIHKMAAVDVLDAPYLDVGLLQMVRKRAVWLCVLFFGGLLTTTAMAHYEEELNKASVLAIFIPLIIASGGNSGSQATSLIIRALALGELTLGDWGRVLLREFKTGIVLGAVLGLIVVLRIVFSPWRAQTFGPHAAPVAVAVCLSLICVVAYGTLVGSMLPLILRRCGVDPAVSSAPFVATVVDVTGIVIYFSVAAVLLRGTLL